MEFFKANKKLEAALHLLRNKVTPTASELTFEILKGVVITVAIHFVSELVIGKIEGEKEETPTVE